MLVTYMIANQNDFTRRYKCDICGCDVNCLHSLSFSRKTVLLNGSQNLINYGIHSKGHKLCLKNQIPILLDRKTEENPESLKVEGQVLDITQLEATWLSTKLNQANGTVEKWLEDGWIPVEHHQSLIKALNL